MCYQEREHFSGLSVLVLDEVECSTFYSSRVAKRSQGLFPPAFVITTLFIRTLQSTRMVLFFATLFKKNYANVVVINS